MTSNLLAVVSFYKIHLQVPGLDVSVATTWEMSLVHDVNKYSLNGSHHKKLDSQAILNWL